MQLMPQGEKLFKVICRVQKISDDEARKLGQEVVKYFSDADVKYEFWGSMTQGTTNMEFTTMFSMKGGGEAASEKLARIIANLIWHCLGDYREPIKIKCAPFGEFKPNSPVYVAEDDVYYCDFFDQEFTELMAERLETT